MDREKMTKEEKDIFDKYKEIGHRAFSAIGIGSTSSSSAASLSDNVSKEDVEDWFLNPDTFSKEIRDFSRLLYIKKGVYYTAINFYTNLLTLDYVLIPRFVHAEDIDKDAVIDSKMKAVEYCDDILQKPVVRNIIKATLKDGCYFGYERSDKGVFYLQRLPNDFCREDALIGGLPSISFDFDYFTNREEKLEMYDSEFTTKFNAYQNGTEDRWQRLDHLKTICIPMESEDFNFPALSGVMSDLIDLDDYHKYMKQSIELDVARILIQTPPMNKETGEMLVDPEEVRFFQSAIAEVLDERFKVVSTPFEVDSIKFTQSQSGDSGLSSVDKMRESIWNGVGIPKSIFGEPEGATGQKISLDANISYVMAIVEKIEMWINRKLRGVGTKQHSFKVKYMSTTRSEESFGTFNDLLSIGGSLEAAIANAGINPDDYMGLLQLENIVGIKDDLTLPQSIHTQGGDGERGAPKKEEVTDGGDATRDGDGNDR